MTGSAVSDKNRKGISLYLAFLLWPLWSASDNEAVCALICVITMHDF